MALCLLAEPQNLKIQLGSQSTGEGGSNRICSGFQGWKDLRLTMPHSLAQNHCSHYDQGDSGASVERARADLCATGSLWPQLRDKPNWAYFSQFSLPVVLSAEKT